MIYALYCKPEYFNTWVSILKRELAGFATVEIAYPAQLKTVSEDMDFIVSPSGNYSVIINIPSNVEENARESGLCVYVVSDGGCLLISGHYFEVEIDEKYLKKGTHLWIEFSEWKTVNRAVFNEMYSRVTSILEQMKVDN